MRLSQRRAGCERRARRKRAAPLDDRRFQSLRPATNRRYGRIATSCLASFRTSQTSIAPPGQLYFRLYSLLSDAKIEAVVLCPWLKRGGADKGALQFVEYYAKQGGVALITTLDADSPWLEKACKGVQTIEFGKLAKDLSEDEKITVLTRLLLELAPKIVHNMNSDLGWRCFSRHGKALRSNGAKLVASLFGDELTPSGRPFGYAITYMPEVRDFIDLVVIDNAPYRDTLRRRYFLPERRVRRVPFWHELPAHFADGRLARRVTRARERALGRQALRTEAYRHTLSRSPWRAQTSSSKCSEKATRRSPSRCGAAGSPACPMSGCTAATMASTTIADRGRYRAFLYTTAFDGLPNVLLEAASHGLAIVAPQAIGGLADLIGPETAFPVDDAAEAGSYVRALRSCIADPDGSDAPGAERVRPGPRRAFARGVQRRDGRGALRNSRCRAEPITAMAGGRRKRRRGIRHASPSLGNPSRTELIFIFW